MEREQKTAVSINWKHWVQLDLWTLRQGTLLLLSLPPDHVSDALMAGNFPEAVEYRNIRSLAEASVTFGILVPHDPQVLSEPQFVPQEFVAWADSKKIDVPDDLHCFLGRNPKPVAVTSVASSPSREQQKARTEDVDTGIFKEACNIYKGLETAGNKVLKKTIVARLAEMKDSHWCQLDSETINRRFTLDDVKKSVEREKLA